MHTNLHLINVFFIWKIQFLFSVSRTLLLLLWSWNFVWKVNVDQFIKFPERHERARSRSRYLTNVCHHHHHHKRVNFIWIWQTGFCQYYSICMRTMILKKRGLSHSQNYIMVIFTLNEKNREQRSKRHKEKQNIEEKKKVKKNRLFRIVNDWNDFASSKTHTLRIYLAANIHIRIVERAYMFWFYPSLDWYSRNHNDVNINTKTYSFHIWFIAFNCTSLCLWDAHAI